MPPKKDSQHYYGFDSTGLEKAAAAAKYLDQSSNSKAAFDIALKTEETKKLEYEENIKKLEIQKSQISEEERRKTIQFETEMHRRQAEYTVQLELQRDQQKLQQKEAMRRQRREQDEESIARQEALKRQTLEYEYQLRASVEQQKLNQELAAQQELAGQNQAFVSGLFDKAEKDKRETQRQNLVTTFNMLGSSVSSALMNPKFIWKAAYLSVLVFGAFHCTKLGIALAGQSMMSRFGKPTLVRETSKLHSNNYFLLPFVYARKQFLMRMKRTEKDLLEGVILEKKLEDQLREISYAVLNRRKHYAPCKNMMFYGPPGTGKTLFAKKLAMQSGLEYAVMVGSDIAPLGPLAVTELNNLFDWAEKQQNGMILFIDEADAFLRNRKSNEMSEYMRHTINSFLYRTGSPSEKVIIVMATNGPEQLDEAVHDRIDEVVGFGVPNKKERQIMLYHYLVKYCTPPKSTWEKAMFIYKYPRSIYTGKKLIRMEGVSHEIIERIANETEGFSGREIMKMVVAWHDAAFTLPDAVLTPQVMDNVLHKFHLQHKLKETWTKEEALIFEKMLSLGEDQTGSATKKEKDQEMLKSQEEIIKEIETDRNRLRDIREHQSDTQN